MAYVVILHLSPDHESHLAEVLQRLGADPGHAGQRPGTRSSPTTSTCIPPEPEPGDGGRPPGAVGDHAVRGAAGAGRHLLPHAGRCARAARGRVVLSGTGADGSMGMKRVKERGGVCLVQDPDEAESRRHAAQLDCDRPGRLTSLPVAEMPARIIAYSAQPAMRPICRAAGAIARCADEQALRDIFTQLRVAHRPRLLQLQARHGAAADRAAHGHPRAGRPRRLRAVTCASTPDESQALLKDLLISVTNFFRDRDAFEALERHGDSAGCSPARARTIRCGCGWPAARPAKRRTRSACCSPSMPTAGAGAPAMQVFATDIDEAAIATARDGLYTLNDAADVSPERLRRFFTKEDERLPGPQGAARDDPVRAPQRDQGPAVLASRPGLVPQPADLPQPPAQRRVMEILHFALNPGGYLFLGSSESVEGVGRSVRRGRQGRAPLSEPRGVAPRLRMPVLERRARRADSPRHGRATTASSARSASDCRTPICISGCSSNTRRRRWSSTRSTTSCTCRSAPAIFLQFAGGEPSHQPAEGGPPGAAARAAHRAVPGRAAARAAWKRRARPSARRRRRASLTLIVRPVLREEDTARGFFLVLFEETADARQSARPTAAYR